MWLVQAMPQKARMDATASRARKDAEGAVWLDRSVAGISGTSDNVVWLDAERQKREPHLTGRARCLACKHEWQAVAPVGAVWLACPACSLNRGRLLNHVEWPDPVWHCACGCDLFYVAEDAICCPNCGEAQIYPIDPTG